MKEVKEEKEGDELEKKTAGKEEKRAGVDRINRQSLLLCFFS